MPKQAQNTPSSRRKARRFAMTGLYEWHMSGNPPFEIEARYRVENAMHTVDLGYFHELLHQTVQRVASLDEIFTPFLDRPLAQINPVELSILRLGCYELQQHPEVPYRIVINEAVELAKDFGATDSYKYVNGVLDKVARQVRNVEVQAPQNTPE